MGQERERLIKMQQQFEDEERYGAVDFLRHLIEEWLPELERSFRTRLR